MPRKAKEESNITENKTKKSTTSKAVVTKKTASKSVSKKTTTTKKATTKKQSNSKRSTSSKKSTKNTKTKKIEILEYYDLPYRYNQTVVKILAQTPTTLFVYWDISDKDRENYIKQYGEYFFNDTKPVLVVHNNTKNYSFEIDINDFANSWYIHVSDSNCDYAVELGRRPINKYAKIDNYLYISSSNDIESPNDHILFDKLNNNIYFKNVKNNIVTKKDISLSFLTKIGKIYNIQEFYEKLYPEEDINTGKIGFLPSSKM